jgi:hypothetical protein
VAEGIGKRLAQAAVAAKLDGPTASIASRFSPSAILKHSTFSGTAART